MPNAQIGSSQFIGDRTPVVLDPMMELETNDRPGVDGHEFREIGERAPVTRWQTFADTTSPAATIAAYKALSGTLQTITNVDGSTVSSVRVQLLRANYKKVAAAVGGLAAGTWVVEADWELQASI